jgi:hypothetical protein
VRPCALADFVVPLVPEAVGCRVGWRWASRSSTAGCVSLHLHLNEQSFETASDTFGLQKAKPSALSTFGGGTESQKLQMTTGMKVLTALKTLARALP